MDRWDVLGVMGTLLIAAGLWVIWPPATALWMGAVMLIIAALGAHSHGHTD